ncbi:beta strand repeat-containing protein [Methylomonas sp. HW2-6]|uniref:beta strand repeat-containing protein n=1 Tax=Methylomonas sp. HW2-6 TaxID=3376687 RepID=UPI0040423101
MNRFRSPAAMGVLGFSVRLGVAFLSLPGPALAAVCTWEGGDSVWSTPGNWSCAAVPGNADDAVLNTDDNLDLDVAATVQKFTLASASAVLQGSGPLTSNSAFDLQSGTVSAILAGNQGANKTTAGSVTLSGANTYTGTTQVNAGTLIFNGSGNHTLTGSYTGAGTLEFAGGTNQFATGATIATANFTLSGGSNHITSGAGVTSANITLSGGNNTIDKALSVTSFTASGGTNTLNAALTATNATFSGDETVDTTDINAGYTVSGTTTINGGKVNFASSTPAVLGQTLVINDGHVTFAAAVTEVDQYIQTGGTLSGPGELRVSSATLSGGSMLGPGKFIIDGNGGTSTNLQLTGNFQLDNQSTLINSGNVVVAATAALQGNGSYRQTAGTTQVDGNWTQALTEIQAGVLRGNGSVGGQLVNQGTLGANGNNLVLNGPVTGSGAHVRPLSRRRRTDKR